MIFWNTVSAFLALTSLVSAGSKGTQPKILSRSGELIFDVPMNRNISFRTSGSGCVHVNGVDLTSAAKLVKNASDLIETYKETFDDTIGRIDELDHLVNGPNGLLKRVQILETGGGNWTRRPFRPQANIANLTRSVRALERKVDHLMRMLEENNCNSNPCDNGGTCLDMFNGFLCHCPEGWQGPQCKEDVNECTRFIGTDLGCQNGATCINKRGTYACQCPHGWYGVHCTSRTNDCSTAGSRLCGPHGTCVQQNTEEGYSCICNQGWKADESGQICIDVDECATNSHLCSKDPPVQCINTPGSYTCGQCPAGFSGSGFFCADIDECSFIDNGGCSNSPKVQCINTRGSRRCGPCPVGYSGDGIHCVYVGDACSYNNGGCHPLAQCKANPSISAAFVSCACPPGYVGNGMGPNGCSPGSVPSNACQSNPCQNGATCVPSFSISTGYICHCGLFYEGVNCEIAMDSCNPNPCLNGGTCTKTNMSTIPYCECPPTHYGRICEHRRQACGGRFTDPQGTLKFPLDNSVVDRSQPYSCQWTIETNTSKVLKLHFKEFELAGESDRCTHDWLEIDEGAHAAEQILGRFCGGELPKGGDLVTSDNIVYLWFRSDHSHYNSHFELEWSTQNSACGGYTVVTSHGGRLASPGSPGKYPNNRDCYWTLVAPIGRRLHFIFYSIDFGPNNDKECSKDYVEFFADQSFNAEVMSKYCENSTLPAPFYSRGNSIRIHFHSDATDKYYGFMLTYSIVSATPGCGGVFTSNTGRLTVPTYNGEYEINLICDYLIQLPINYRIRLTFESLNLESSEDCKYDNIKIYEGPDTRSPLSGTYCGTNKPAPYIFPTNEILLVFRSDYSNGGKGFVAEYEAICGGISRGRSGVIETPGYPESIISTLNCIYEIHVAPAYAIKLTFVDYLARPYFGSDCDFDDYVEIRDGDSERSPLIGKYCQKEEIPSEIISTHNYLWIKYFSEKQQKGFKVNYTTIETGCGGVLKAEGSISPPTEAGKYLQSAYCEWIISAPNGRGIRIHFDSFHLEGEQGDCDFDYLLVFENSTNTNTSGRMGKFCGETKPPDLSSSTNLVTIIFITDTSEEPGPGFVLEYSFYESNNCGGTVYSGAGEITSPNYPNSYPNNLDCVWVISAERYQRIMLNITSFELESVGEDCEYDYVEIRNGKTSSAPLVGKYCGELKDIPTRIPSHTNYMYIRFVTDSSGYNKGFHITWFQIAPGCGGTLTAPVGVVTSPNYPEPYVRNTECSYKIRVNPGSVIKAYFSDIELEESEDCSMDYVELYDGPTPEHRLIGTFCTMNDTRFITSGNNMFVKFFADISNQYRGFALNYAADCNITIRDTSGILESPNYPLPYPHSLSCTWDIIVPHRNKINVTFVSFEIEQLSFYYYEEEPAGNKCSYDYLEVQYVDSFTVDTPKASDHYTTLGKYCGEELPPPVTINANNLRFHFVTDSNNAFKGFQLEWIIFGCGGKMLKPSGEIKSPNYPRGYEPDTQCEWLIQSEFGSSIQLKFDTIDLEVTNNCTADYIRIYNGRNSNSTLLTTLCHQQNETFVTSTGNYMFLQFQADSQHQGKGFSANYTTKPTKCGGKFTAPTGVITSPHYPQNYDEGDSCEWLIEVDEGHTIELEFEDVDLVKEYDVCDEDFVKVYDGAGVEYKVLQEVCADKKPNATVLSSSNQMFLWFKAYRFMRAKGFKAKYRKSCGGVIVTDGSGQIDYRSSSVYNLKQQSCHWTITTNNTDNHVYLTIGHLEGGHCDVSSGHYSLTIYSGDSTRAPLYGQYCTNDASRNIVSPGNALHIVIDRRIDFFATYTIFETECGGTLISSEGGFASPGYPNMYPSGTSCEWTLDMAEGNHVSFTFQVFSLPESPNCNMDFLEVRSNNSSGELLGTFCGNTPPTNLTDIGQVYILLKTSLPAEGDTVTAEGFYAHYSLDRFNELSGPSGIIESPLYPRQYKGFDIFQYRVRVASGKKIVINFLEFYMDYSLASEDRECIYSALEIFDGYDDTAPVLGRYCGFNAPENVTSTANIVLIKMDNSQRKIGSLFKLEWLEISMSSSNKPSTPKSKICGSAEPLGLDELHNYTITSPGYPNGYADDLDCEWIFSTSPSNHLEIYFRTVDFSSSSSEMSLYEYTSCYQDRITIYEGVDGTQNWKELKKVCSRNATNQFYEVKSNLMKVVFHSDTSDNGTGFDAIVFEECGGSIKDTSGMIIVDNTTRHMSIYDCQWNITVRSGRTIKITFPYFQIGPRSTHCDSYLTLRNGEYPDSPFLGKGQYCGTVAPEELQTTSNYLYVEYKAQYQIKGFHMKYQEVSYDCGGTIKLDLFSNSTEITSPNYPNVPPSHVECHWTIEAPPGEALRVDFEDKFDISGEGTCSEEYVEIRDGGTKFSSPIGKFCGNAPNSQHTTENMVHITYFTDKDEPETGFKAKVSIATCGGTMRTLEGDIQSPNYGNIKLYPQNVNCTWHLAAPTNYYYVLKFVEFDLPYSDTSCDESDRITIFEERSRKLEEVKKLCRVDDMPLDLTITSNSVFIQFTTGQTSYHDFNGFKIHYNASKKDCIEDIYSPEGYLTSPGWPVLGLEALDCRCTIEVPKGRRVTFEFEDISLGLTEDLWDNYLSVYNDKENYAPITKIKSDTITTPVIKSTDNIMVINYGSIGGSTLRGLKGRFSSDEPTVCVGSLDQELGSISSPVNVSTFYCQWKRVEREVYTTSEENETFAMTIQASATNYSSYFCRYEYYYLKIQAGSDESIIKAFCENGKYTETVRTPLKQTVVEAYSSEQGGLLNFTINYRSYACGGILHSEYGNFSSPNYPNASSSEMECSWLIELPSEQSIQLTFNDFELDNDCEKNYLEVYNGQYPTAPKIGKFCNNNKPPVIHSQANYIWIDYHSANGVKAKGFNASYEPVIHGCGGVYHEDTRIIQTPNYPKDYPKNSECVWEIRAPAGHHISFNFFDRFHLETSNNCENDFVEVFDKKDEEWTSLGRKCGRTSPKEPLNSTSNYMRVMFRSNNDNSVGTGFKAKWVFVCGGHFKFDEVKRYVSSPGYPKAYGKNLKCIYNFTGDGIFDIVFEDFDLEGTKPRCSFDFLKIQSVKSYGFNTRVEFKSVHCETKLPPIQRFEDNAVITFETDDSIENRGFKFWYKKEACGGTITSPATIKSPYLGKSIYRDAVSPSRECQWKIIAPKDRAVTIKIEKLNTESYCKYSGIAVYRGSTVESKNLTAAYCGKITKNLPIVQVRTNEVVVVMRGDFFDKEDSIAADILFTYPCGGDFELANATEETIRAPNHPDIDCVWTFSAKPGYNIKVEFTSFNLKANCSLAKNYSIEDCPCSFVEIRNGISHKNALMERICHNTSSANLQRKFVTSDRYAYIRLSSVGDNNEAFTAKVSSVLSVCGEPLLSAATDVKNLTSPFYPHPYPSDRHCSWVLKTPSYREDIAIHFVEFDLGEDNNNHTTKKQCTGDRLIFRETLDEISGFFVYDDGERKPESPNAVIYNGEVPGEHQFCGRNEKPFDYYPSQNEVEIIFYSGPSENKGKGFMLEYRVAGCSRNYTDLQERIKLNKLEGNCSITIERPIGYTINIYFNNFYMPHLSDNNCSEAGIEIFEGNVSGKSLLRTCGYATPNPVFSKSNKLWIHIWGAEKQQIYDLDMTYTSTTAGPGCGGSIYNTKGQVTSPMYPFDYRNDTTCTWQIRVPFGMEMALRFDVFDIQAPCNDNWVEVATFTGRSATVHKFCRNDKTAILRSDNKMSITYKASRNNGGSGWVAKFAAIDDFSEAEYIL